MNGSPDCNCIVLWLGLAANGMRGEVYILETDMFDTSHGGDVASGCAVNRTPRQAL